MKEKIPKALREQVWITHVGKKFESKCVVRWCKNKITVFDFQSGHNVPESKGGATDLLNLRPICSRCNSSMNDTYTIDEWEQLSKPPSKWKLFWEKHNCFKKKCKPSDTKENGTKLSPNPMSQNVKHSKFRGILSENHSLPKKKRTARGTKTSRTL
jgi:hypothetical protein